MAAAVGEVLAMLVPARCLGCGGRLPPGAPPHHVCGPCLTRLRPPPHPRCPRCGFPLGTGRAPAPTCLACDPWPGIIEKARCTTVLRPPADALVHGLKYQGWRQLAPLMGERMAALDLAEARSPAPVVVPVPTTRSRRRRRGYNQAALLAAALAQRRGWGLADALERPGETRTQVSLHPEERRANVRRAFAPRTPQSEAVEGRKVVLVDDVLTTGATVSAAAVTLERAGASGVCVVAFARAVPDLPAAGSP